MSLNRLVRAAILLVLILTLVSQAVGFLARSPLPFLVGVEGREAYLERTLGDYYSAIRDMNQIVSPDDRVLFLWEPRSYLCSFDSAQDRRPACQPDNLLFNWRYDLYRYGDIDAILESWRKTGFTHVLLHNSGLRYFSETVPGDVAPEHIESLRDMERRHLQALFGPGLGGSEAGEPVLKDGYTLYQILY